MVAVKSTLKLLVPESQSASVACPCTSASGLCSSKLCSYESSCRTVIPHGQLKGMQAQRHSSVSNLHMTQALIYRFLVMLLTQAMMAPKQFVAQEYNPCLLEQCRAQASIPDVTTTAWATYL